MKVAMAVWAFASIPAVGFVIMKTTGFFNGRDYAAAKLGALGTVFLPIVGVSGAVTAFALIPAGLIASFLLRQPSWRSVFAEYSAAGEPLTADEANADGSEADSVAPVAEKVEAEDLVAR
jgi:hypothetical protein